MVAPLLLRSSLIAKVKLRPSLAALFKIIAIIRDREDQGAAIPGRTIQWVLEPDVQAGDKLRIVDRLSHGTRKIRGFSKLPYQVYANVRREPAGDLVAQPQSELDIGQSRADAALRIVANVQIDFEVGRQNQALAEQDVVFRLEASRAATG